ncbi:hypothetical protein RB595_009611 [Gaeumannomyces hyphopodioides]
MGNGNRAQQKRERNAKDQKGIKKSQLKVNEQAKKIQCEICKVTFLSTIRGEDTRSTSTQKGIWSNVSRPTANRQTMSRSLDDNAYAAYAS